MMGKQCHIVYKGGERCGSNRVDAINNAKSGKWGSGDQSGTGAWDRSCRG